MNYKCAVDDNETPVGGYKTVIAISPDQGQTGEYSDGYGNYHYTYQDFVFDTIPTIPQDVIDWLNEDDSHQGSMLFKTDGAQILAKTVWELENPGSSSSSSSSASA